MLLTSHVLLQMVRSGCEAAGVREDAITLDEHRPLLLGPLGGTAAGPPEKTAASWSVIGFGETLSADYNQTPSGKQPASV